MPQSKFKRVALKTTAAIFLVFLIPATLIVVDRLTDVCITDPDNDMADLGFEVTAFTDTPVDVDAAYQAVLNVISSKPFPEGPVGSRNQRFVFLDELFPDIRQSDPDYIRDSYMHEVYLDDSAVNGPDIYSWFWVDLYSPVMDGRTQVITLAPMNKIARDYFIDHDREMSESMQREFESIGVSCRVMYAVDPRINPPAKRESFLDAEKQEQRKVGIFYVI